MSESPSPIPGNTPLPPEVVVARIGRALGHPLRVRVLALLVDGMRYRAGALARRFHVALPLMKQHVARLLDAQLIVGERLGGTLYYRLGRGEHVQCISALLAQVEPPGGGESLLGAGDPLRHWKSTELLVLAEVSATTLPATLRTSDKRPKA